MHSLTRRRAAMALLLAVAGCKENTGPHLGPLSHVDIIAGNAQTAAAGTVLATPLVVIARDDAGNALPGQVVNFVVVSGGGSVFAPAVQTNAEGKAQNQWTLGTTVGQAQQIEVRAVDATGAPIVFATFTATVTPGAVTQLVKVAGDAQSGSIASPLPDSLQVKALDSYGNAVPNATVTWTSPYGGTLTPASSPTRADGTTRAAWTTGTHVSAVATATAAGATAVSFAATAAVTAATNAVITKLGGDGQTVASGTLTAQPMTFSVTLPDGRPIVGARAGFAMKWSTGGSAWNSVTGDNGVISMSQNISAPAGPYTITAGVNGASGFTMVGSTAAFTLTVVPGAPATALIAGKSGTGSLTPPGTDWIPGTALWTSSPLAPPTLFSNDSVEVLVQDAAGNPTPNVTVTWTAGDGAVARPATSVTGVNGKARTHFVVNATAFAKSRIYASVGTGAVVDSAFVIPVTRSGVTLSISPTPVRVAVGADGDLVVQMNGKDVDSDFLTVTSSNPAVATVTTVTPRGIPARAKVSGVAAGTATLTATIGAATGVVTVSVGTGGAVCGEATCQPVTAAYISHYTEAGCTGTESYYTAYNGYDGIRRSWDGQGIVGTTLRTITNRSYRDASGTCYDAWPAGNTLSDFVIVYR